MAEYTVEIKDKSGLIDRYSTEAKDAQDLYTSIRRFYPWPVEILINPTHSENQATKAVKPAHYVT